MAAISALSMLLVLCLVCLVFNLSAGFVISSRSSSSAIARLSSIVPRLAPLMAEKEAKEKAEVLGKPELVDTLREKTGLLKKDVEALLQAFSETVNEKVLIEGKELRIRDLGTFKRKVSAPRIGRNPKSGEEINILGSKSVTFSVSSALKIKDDPKTTKAPAKKAPAKK